MSDINTIIDPTEFTKVVKKLREFFDKKGFLEVHAQNRLSILAACEDPKTISTFNYGGQVFPLPQTSQMWLEYELLKDPKPPGFYSVSTSYRNEPNPIKGRHDKIFPMFEFELKGDMNELIKMERELLEHLGFGNKDEFPEDTYINIAKKYDTKELTHEHETLLDKDVGHVVFIKDFPNYTSPFWNMKQSPNKDVAKKVDVIIHGIETIGSAERSTNPDEMRSEFHTISDGNYADILYSHFSKERVENELNEFLSYDFFERSGGGIGVTRLIRAMKLSNLL